MADSVTTAGPTLLDPILVERIWGATSLEPWHPAVPSNPVGEIWLTAETCKVADGPAQGQTLQELTGAAPEAFGDPDHEDFPLLIKLLFPREKLSVQVHPNDIEAQALGMPRGKTECWYVLSADPGAEVAVGFKEPLTKEAVKASIQDGTLEEKLQMIPVKAGDMVFVDAGTVHAIGPGMVVLETQQYSDTTYRLWDYNRPRELHIDAGTAVTRTATAAGLVAPRPMEGFTRLVSCEYFIVDRFDLAAGEQASLDQQENLQLLIALDHGCAVDCGNGQAVACPRGQAVLLPVGSGTCTVKADEAAAVIRILKP